MRALKAALWAIILCSGAVLPASSTAGQRDISATPWTEVHAARVRLVAGQARTAEGRYLAGLEIAMADGWKTYWRMPGDSGVPPTFDWAGSMNVAATDVLFPAPMRMPEAGGVAIGYKQHVLLPIEVTPRDPARPVVLKLALEFGVCREICIPATGQFELSIPASGAKGGPPAQIAAALERVPRAQHSRRKGDPELRRVALESSGPSPKLVIDAAFAGGSKGADVFVEAPQGFYVPVPTRTGTDANGMVRFQSELGRDLAQDLKGRTLTLTLVSDAGATEARWTVP
jgi:DsbC/DsbD-like thiol-disulfide interchange protein